MIGPYAERLEQLSDAEVAKVATTVLRSMFGSDNIESENGEVEVPEPIGCIHSSWKSDRFARGSWTHFPYQAANNGWNGAGFAANQDADQCREPIFYAGEATSIDFRGTVHGAYLSGIEQAQEVMKVISMN